VKRRREEMKSRNELWTVDACWSGRGPAIGLKSGMNKPGGPLDQGVTLNQGSRSKIDQFVTGIRQKPNHLSRLKKANVDWARSMNLQPLCQSVSEKIVKSVNVKHISDFYHGLKSSSLSLCAHTHLRPKPKARLHWAPHFLAWIRPFKHTAESIS